MLKIFTLAILDDDRKFTKFLLLKNFIYFIANMI